VEDAEDSVAVAAVLSDPNQDRIPSDVVARILDGDNPVKVWREHRDLTQAQLADAAGLPQPTIAVIETGRRKGTVKQMKAIAAALRINLDTLVS
jgi:DNA-binding XRE family transcriptional regulator